MSEQPAESITVSLPPHRKDVKRRPRLVVSETLYHQNPGQQAVSCSPRFLRWLTSEEQPFVRLGVQVGPDWQPLETGWIARASMLSLSNDSPPESDDMIEVGILISPPEDQRRTMHSPERFAPFIVSFAVLPPGESLRYSPSDLAALRMRSTCGAARCTLRLYPE